MIPGIDVSHYQGMINWTAVAESGVKFAFIKASEGSDMRDFMFVRNWIRARSAGLLVGPYHYLKASLPAAEQFANFVTSYRSLERSASLPVVIDIEEDGITPDLVLNWIKCAADDSMNITNVMIYADRSMAERLIGLEAYPLWLAAYTVDSPEAPEPWKAWSFWQETWGRVSGISTPCDQDWFCGDEEQLKAMCIT